MCSIRYRAVVVALGVAAIMLSAPPGVHAAAFQPSFNASACPRFVTPGTLELDVDPAADMTCGFLTVLESRSDPSEGTIKLFVTIAEPSDGSAPADPVLNIGRSLNWNNPSARPAQRYTSSGRTNITLDQRGGGYSEPNLACPEVQHLTDPDFGVSLGTPAMEDALVDAVGACHDRLVDDGVDLSAYNVAEAAADVEDLRVALGVDRWNLITYGTASEILYEVLRRYPEHIRTAVMDSPQAATVDRFTQAVAGTKAALRAVFRACRASARCDDAFPKLHETWIQALHRLDDHPSQITDEGLHVVVDAATAVRYVRNMLMEHGLTPRVPLGIYDLLQHGWVDSEPLGSDVRWSSAPPLSTGFDINRGQVLSEGDFYSGLCHDELPFLDHEAFDAAADRQPWYREAYADDWYQRVCDVWDVGRADLDPHRRLASDVPTLVFVGGRDPYAPTGSVRKGMRYLSTSWLIEAPNWSQNVFGNVPCATDVRDAWYEAPHHAPAMGCYEATFGADPFVRRPKQGPTDDGSRIRTIAGNALVHNGSLGDGGPASQATMFPFDIDIDDEGNLYVLDAGNLLSANADSTVRKIDTGGTITTVAGHPAGAASLAPPGDAGDLLIGGSLAVDGDGNVYLPIGNTVTRVSPSGAVDVIAGTGESGNSGDGGPATEATLRSPGDVAVDDDGNLYIPS